jgi:hypothetical protein
MGDTMRECHRFTGACARYYEQGTGPKTVIVTPLTIFSGVTLRRIKKTQMINFLLGNLHETPP